MALRPACSFIGYALFEVPSNMLLQRSGRESVDPHQVPLGNRRDDDGVHPERNPFYILRFLLGVAEAVSSRGDLLLTRWLPGVERGKAIGFFSVARRLPR